MHQRTGKPPDTIEGHLAILLRCQLVGRSGAVYTPR
ncbi:hypothetical protein AB0O58_16250 [Rhodococcus sp. NPDC080181]